MSLDCSQPIYEESYFIFDTEDVVVNYGYIFNQLPPIGVGPAPGLITEIPNANNVQVLISSASIYYLADPIWWCGLAAFLFFVLLAITLIFQCCTCCFCCCKKGPKPVACRIVFGIIGAVMVAATIACLAVICWAEFQAQAGADASIVPILSYISRTVNSADPQFESALQTPYFVYTGLQLYRHWVSFGVCLATILLFLGIALSSFLCTPLCRSCIPTCLFLFFNLMLTTLILLLLAAAMFNLFYIGFFCYDLYQIGDGIRCVDPAVESDAIAVQEFCSTGAYLPTQLVWTMYIVVALLMIFWQIVGAIYAASFHGARDTYENRHGKVMEMPPASQNITTIVYTSQPSYPGVQTTTMDHTMPPPMGPMVDPPMAPTMAPMGDPPMTPMMDPTIATVTPPTAPPQYDNNWTQEKHSDML